MADIRREIQIELDNIRQTLEHLTSTLQRPERTAIELAAIGAFIHNFYNGIENILKRIIPEQNYKYSSSSWHKDLLHAAVQSGVIKEQTLDSLFSFLGFRHIFIHGYTAFLDAGKLLALTDTIEAVLAQFKSDIEAYSGWQFK